MKYQGIDKFEYKYIKLSINLEKSIDKLNQEGESGWEVIKLFEPQTALYGDVFKVLLKRKITEVEV